MYYVHRQAEHDLSILVVGHHLGTCKAGLDTFCIIRRLTPLVLSSAKTILRELEH